MASYAWSAVKQVVIFILYRYNAPAQLSTILAPVSPLGYIGPMSTVPAPSPILYDRAEPVWVDMRTIGSEGLAQSGGHIYQDLLKELQGRRAVEIYREMSDNDATCGALLNLISQMLKKITWSVSPASQADFDVKAADFVQSCLDDMETTFAEFLNDCFTGGLRYGFAIFERCYKRRAGAQENPLYDSHYSDGHIGLRSLAGRAQDTIYRWLFDDSGRLLGFVQQAPPKFRIVEIPISKCLLFRPRTERNNPEGVSVLRQAYRSWFIKRSLENIEATGVEKDIAGMPVVWVPREVMAMAQQAPFYSDGTPNPEVQSAKKMLARFEEMATEMRQNAHAGLVMPSEYDEQNNKRFDITLLSSPGSKQLDVGRLIDRYDQAILRTQFADFLTLGASGGGGSGSYAMHTDKTALFWDSLEGYLKVFTEAFNEQVIKPLLRVNSIPYSDYPKLEFSGLRTPDLGELGDFIVKCSQAGMELFPDGNLEDFIRKAAGWPAKTELYPDVSDVAPQDMGNDPPVEVHHDEDVPDDAEEQLTDAVGGTGVPHA